MNNEKTRQEFKKRAEDYFKVECLFARQTRRTRVDAVALYSKIVLDNGYSMTELSKEINVRPNLIRKRLIYTNERLEVDKTFIKAYNYIKDKSQVLNDDVLSVDDIKSIFNIDIRQKTKRREFVYLRMLYIEQELERNIDCISISKNANVSLLNIRMNKFKIENHRDNAFFKDVHEAFKTRNGSIMPDFMLYRKKRHLFKLKDITSVVKQSPLANRTLTGKEISDILRLDMKSKLWNKDVRLFTEKDMKEVYRIRDENLIKI
jgi:hypothetical protein